MQPTKKTAAFWIALIGMAVLVGGVFLSQHLTIEAQFNPPTAGKFDPRQLDDLRKIVGNNQVSVFVLYNANPMRGRIIGVSEFFGRRFLQLQAPGGQNQLVNIDTIVALNQEL